MGENTENNCIQGTIYKLCFSDNDKMCYIGSTKRLNLQQRLHEHKYDIRTGRCAWNSKGKYFFDRVKDIKLFVLEKCDFTDVNELLEREKYWIENLTQNMNVFAPIRSPTEKKVLNKIYYQKIKDKLKLKYLMNKKKNNV